MAAGVHHTGILEQCRRLVRLLNRQCHRYPPQGTRHLAVVLCALQRAEHACFAHACVRDAELVQFLLNALRPVELLPGLSSGVDEIPRRMDTM